MEKDDRAKTLSLIGQRVRQRRRELTLTQEELAQRAEISKSFVSELESGHTPASGLVYLKLAEELDVSIEWLLQGATHAGVATTAPGVEIPHVVEELAEELAWSYPETVEVAAALQVVIARRTRGGRLWEPSKEYVKRVAEALRSNAGDK